MNRKTFIKNSIYGSAAVGLALNNFSCSSHKNITILHTNDVHSHIEPFPKDHSKFPNMGGFERRSTLINNIRLKNPNTLLLDAGDVFQGTPYFNFYGGELEFKLMSMLKYDAMTIGNHDFDNGIDGLVHLSDLSWTESGDIAVRNYKKGDDLKTTLISADIERERISLGVKQLTVNKFQEYVQDNPKGSIVKGKVIDKSSKIISVELQESVLGSLKLSELLSDKSIDSINDNDELDLMITNIDKKNQAISLSMKAIEKKNEDKALDDYNKNNDSVGTSLGDILKEQIDK